MSNSTISFQCLLLEITKIGNDELIKILFFLTVSVFSSISNFQQNILKKFFFSFKFEYCADSN